MSQKGRKPAVAKKADSKEKAKSKPKYDLSTKPPSVKQPGPKDLQKPVPPADGFVNQKPVSQPVQRTLFKGPEPAPRKVEDPVVDVPPAAPVSTLPPVDPPISGEIAYPPAESFTAPFVEGTLAHHLTLPASRPDRVVSSTFQKQRYPWVSEWTGAADAGDPCIRKLAYQRLDPERALPDDGEMAFLFKHGQWVEKETLAEMAEAGYEVVEQQRPFHDRELMVKGKIDGKLILHHNGRRFKPPFEIKGYAPTTWDRIDTAKDMLESNAGYLKKVPAQVMLYLVLDKEQDADAGILYMKNKLTGKPKTVIVPRDEKYAAWLLKRLQMLRDYVQRKVLPPRIDFDESVCGKCPFRHVCLQEMPPGVNNPVVLDPAKAAILLELLETWWKLNPDRKVWTEVDKKISAIVRGHPKIIVGDFVVTGTPGTQTRIDTDSISDEHRKLYEKTTPTWRKGIVNVKDTSGVKEAE